MTEKLLLSDPVGALVEYLSSHTLIQDAGRCQYVTAPLLTQQVAPDRHNPATRDRAQGFRLRKRPGARRASSVRLHATA